MRTRREVLAASGGGVLAGVAGCARLVTDGGETTADVQAIAHRGCAAQYPENTVFAVQRAAPHVDVVEVDVRRCGSGELVVFHDERLDRVTDATGLVAETDWERLHELAVLDSGQPVPRLADLLAAVPADTGVNVELKHDGMAADVLAATDAAANDVLLSSFSRSALRELRRQRADAPLAYVFAERPARRLEAATALDCVAVHPEYSLLFGSEFVSVAHDAGLAVNVWTVDSAATAEALVAAGVDGLILDRWDVL